MRDSIQAVLVSVWRQILLQNSTNVTIENRSYRVKRAKNGLRQVDFFCEGIKIRGLEQNPNSQTRWGQMAREGKLIMQFQFDDAYVANVADGLFNEYRGPSTSSDPADVQ